MIVLAFVVLLSGLVVAYLSRAGMDRESANGAFNDAKADQLARSALEVIVGDLKQEIANGSTAAPLYKTTIYTPSASSNVLPQRSGVAGGSPDPLPNLIKISLRNDPISAPGVSSRASAVNSTTDPSVNMRSISLARWNKHYLLPRPAAATPTDTTPISGAGGFSAPDWVFVTDNGPSVISAVNNAVVGRYSYSVYDEGGLLDANLAGFPPAPNTTVAQSGPKGAAAFADLTVTGLSASAVNDLVGWRNFASAQPTGTFASFSFTTASATNYFNFVLANTNGFVATSGSVFANRTDQMFLNRQALIQYRSSTAFSANGLQHLGTFTRDLNIPTWGPSLTARVSVNFVRSDGSKAYQGEPLFRRFPLSKIGWLGSTGPVAPGTAATVLRDFGLVWNTDHWDYYGADGTAVASAIRALTGSREPEFFQILDFARQNVTPRPTIGEILSLGASLIDQYDGDNTTTTIEYAGLPPTPPATPAPHPRAYGMENQTPPTPAAAPTPPAAAVVLNRRFRSVGELGYAFKTATSTLDLYTAGSADAAILDFFSFSSAYQRAGQVNLNTRDSLVMGALVTGALRANGGITVVSATNGKNAGSDIVTATGAGPLALSRQDLARLTAAVRSSAMGSGEEERELIARSVGEISQIRTWNLLVDAIAQSGRYPPTATALADFVVNGEHRYWLHVAIDRFTGEVIDQQLEAVYE